MKPSTQHTFQITSRFFTTHPRFLLVAGQTDTPLLSPNNLGIENCPVTLFLFPLSNYVLLSIAPFLYHYSVVHCLCAI